MRTWTKISLRLLVVALFIGALCALYFWGFEPTDSTAQRLWPTGLTAFTVLIWSFLYFQIRYPKFDQRRARYVSVFGHWAGRLADWNKGRDTRAEARLKRLYGRLAVAEAKLIVTREAGQAQLEQAFPPDEPR